jgi:hypothetical protein
LEVTEGGRRRRKEEGEGEGERSNTLRHTAYPHRQKLIHLLLISRYRTNPELWKSWTKEFFNKLKPSVVGMNFTYADETLAPGECPKMYWKENYPLLQEIKSSSDPQNFFSHPQGVKPVGSL